ncbi:MAG TPA: hypothetical protein VGR53_09230 [Nitrososphaerales archaeon]|nr:hypothetical protein [Nitrososphaerales archaeon]
MRRVEVWIDCEEEREEETRRKVKAALDTLGIEYTLIYGSYEIVKKGSQK